jgi:hypothetical protein
LRRKAKEWQKNKNQKAKIKLDNRSGEKLNG